MVMLKCKMCGGDLNVVEGMSVCECEYCGSKQTVPVADDEKKLVQFERAELLRKKCEFDKAAGIYETIVADFRQEAEAYWGLVLCKYGIEYVDDPATGKKVPTCHRSSFDSVMEDSDLEQALENADEEARRVYRQEAKQIEELRKGIISVSANEQPYDIFICYKETDSKGDRTLDSVLAQDMYDTLTDKGYRVFFARITLEDKLGMEYEPYIFAALNSARIMLTVGTDYEYYNAVWVKNEWSRFLKLMAQDKEKHLIPCYKGIDAYDLPKEFAKLQAQDLGKMGAMQDILRGIEKIIGVNKTVVKETVVVGGGQQVAPLLKRAFMYLEDGDWSSADEYCEKVLDIDPECAEAYLAKLMAELQVRKRENLKNQQQPFDHHNLYHKAIRFGDAELQAELKGYNEYIVERNRETAYTDAVSAMNAAVTEQQYKTAAGEFEKLSNYKDAAQRVKECIAKADEVRKEGVYRNSVGAMQKRTITDVNRAITGFRSVLDWKDSAAKLEECEKLLKQLQEEQRIEREKRAEQQRIAEEKRAEEERAALKMRVEEELAASEKAKRKKRRIIVILVSIFLAVWIGYFGVYPFVAYQQGNYKVYIDMYNVKKFTIPDGVTEIKELAFFRCTSLTEVVIPNSVTTIGAYAFEGCDSLTSVTIPSSVTSISGNAFLGCTDLREIAVDSQAMMDSGCFSECPALESVTIGDSVTAIGAYAFYGCDALTEVTIPDSVTTIGESAFQDCDSLEAVTIGNSVTTIGGWAFINCDSLEAVYITDLAAWCAIRFGNEYANPIRYAKKVYENGELVTDLVIPDGVTTIGDEAFKWCKSLTSVAIPDSVTTIGNYAFSGCDSLTSVTIGDSVTTIGVEAFYWCDSLSSVTIPDSVTAIGEGAFYSCSSLTSVTIPDSVTTIGDRAFGHCTSLTSVTIGDGVTTIGSSAFSSCDSLTSVTIGDSVTNIGEHAFWNCDSLTEVTIPDSVTSIGEGAFYSCSSLTSVTIPDSVTSIGEGAFYSCSSLTSVTIPDSVTTIGENAFYSCGSLTDVYFKGTKSQWEALNVSFLYSVTVHCSDGTI